MQAENILQIALDKPNVQAQYPNVMSKALLSEAARLLGSQRSAKKAKTSAENGKKGGRPKKKQQ